MKIYISHKRRSDYETALYQPLRESELSKQHTFIFPHADNTASVNVKEKLKNKEIDMVIAEVSEAATGQGIELAWADIYNIPIICIHKNGADISGSLKFLTDKFITYTTMEDAIGQLEKELQTTS